MKFRSCLLILTLLALSVTSCGQQKSSQKIPVALQQSATKVSGKVEINTFQWGIPIKNSLENNSHLVSQPLAKADYTKLRKLLAAGKWEAADVETANKMLEVAGRQKEGWLDVEDVKNFSCPDLRAMDRLWVKYSRGRFGFSVQKRIYQSLGGTKVYDEKVWDDLVEAVGWSKRKKWLLRSQLTFNLNAPQGHLPVGAVWICIVPGFNQLGWLLFSHAETCKL